MKYLPKDDERRGKPKRDTNINRVEIGCYINLFKKRLEGFSGDVLDYIANCRLAGWGFLAVCLRQLLLTIIVQIHFCVVCVGGTGFGHVGTNTHEAEFKSVEVKESSCTCGWHSRAFTQLSFALRA